MSVATVVTLGYGSFGSVALVVTGGYIPSSGEVEEWRRQPLRGRRRRGPGPVRLPPVPGIDDTDEIERRRSAARRAAARSAAEQEAGEQRRRAARIAAGVEKPPRPSRPRLGDADGKAVAQRAGELAGIASRGRSRVAKLLAAEAAEEDRIVELLMEAEAADRALVLAALKAIAPLLGASP